MVPGLVRWKLLTTLVKLLTTLEIIKYSRLSVERRKVEITSLCVDRNGKWIGKLILFKVYMTKQNWENYIKGNSCGLIGWA